MDRIFFLFVCACWINSLAGRNYAVSRRDALLLRLAMSATLAADFCMLVLYENAWGLVFFLLTQFLYNYRYAGRRMLISQAAASLAVIGLSGFWAANLETRLAAGYLAAFLFSLGGVYGLVWTKKPDAKRAAAYPKINRWLIALGMSAFFLCDVNVGLYNLTAGMPVNGVFHTLEWVFYLPAQAMLSSSARKWGCRTHEHTSRC